MPLITSAGVGSGLDLESIISATLDAERVPKINSLAAKEEKLQVELSSLGEIKSAISSLNDTIEKLADLDNFNKRTATLNQPDSGDVVSVSTNSNSTAGSFDIEVTQLASGSRAVSTASPYTSNTDVITASGGNLTLTAGSDTFNINLAAGATLEDLRTAINESDDNFGVTANIVNTGTEAKLVLSSNTTGAGNDISITNDTAELDEVSTVANAGGAGGLAVAAEDQAKNGIIEVDGITITSDSNTFTDAVQDLTIKALAETEDGDSAKLTVDYDKAGVTTLVDELITNYNQLIGQLGFQSRVDKPLNGDATIRSLSSQVASTLSSTLTDSGPFESIYDIGLGVDKDGYLEKSSLVRSLNDSLDEYYDDVGTAFAGDNGLAKQFESLLGNYIDSDGLINLREENINEQIDALEDDFENHEYRMTQLEARLRQQYTGLDVLMAQMQATQGYLTSSLANLPGFTRDKG